ncbi:MAG: hypothetical protein M5U09_26060 [Gammaproteobacteria bacterium]|nr:hypothetical protein [Gammaproteobacteria bacterium]
MDAVTTTLRRLLSGLCLSLLASLPVSAASVYDLELVVFLNNNTPSSEVDAANPEHAARLDRRLAQLFERVGGLDTGPAPVGGWRVWRTGSTRAPTTPCCSTCAGARRSR